MTYLTGDIPVGNYNPDRIVNVGLGHGALDAGVSYTYFNPESPPEFSVTTGLTYNFTNPAPDYQSGVDRRVDWGLSMFPSPEFQFGLAGYFFQQISGDSGAGAKLGSFESRVAGIRPQVGYLFPIGDRQGCLNLKGYGEFAAAKNRNCANAIGSSRASATYGRRDSDGYIVQAWRRGRAVYPDLDHDIEPGTAHCHANEWRDGPYCGTQ